MTADPTGENFNGNDPGVWSIESFRRHWDAHLAALARSSSRGMSLPRIRFQAEQSPAYSAAVLGWTAMTGEERRRSWQALIECLPAVLSEIAPVCVQCGDCCRQGSPSLHAEDIGLLRAGRIPWEALVTLRRGEPARGAESGEAFYLTEERIKVREKPGTNECVFLDGETSACRIYNDRPLQCRAQACWDAESLQLLATEPLLTRRHLFADFPGLLELLEVHDQRCSFGRMREVFEELKQSEGRSVDRVIELLAMDESFRELVCTQLNVSERIGDLVFGRKLSERVRLFGFTVVRHSDGTQTLLPDRPPEAA